MTPKSACWNADAQRASFCQTRTYRKGKFLIFEDQRRRLRNCGSIWQANSRTMTPGFSLSPYLLLLMFSFFDRVAARLIAHVLAYAFHSSLLEYVFSIYCTNISFAPSLFLLWLLSSLLSRRNIKKTSFFTHVNDCVARYLITIPRLLFTLTI